MNALLPKSPELLLLMSLLALFAGPLLFYFARTKDALMKGLDGFVLVAICGLVFLHILPHTVEEIGWIAIVVILTSLLLPTFIERLKTKLSRPTHTLTLILALLGIALHAFTDGMALSTPIPTHGFGGNMLPMAVILHRVPDGLTIWWLTRPHYGNWAAARTILIMAVATVLGYFLGQTVFAHLSHTGVGVFEAVVGGSLLHVIFHHDHPMQKQSGQQGWQWASGVGALLAMIIVSFITLHATSGTGISYLGKTVDVFFTLALESAPALLLAYFFSGVVQTFLPRGSAAWLKKGSRPVQALKGMGFGLPLPICSCGVIPVYRSLIKQGVPLSAAIAFFVATPELSIDAFLLSLPLLGSQYTFLRLLAAALVALTISVVMDRLAKKNAPPADSADACLSRPPDGASTRAKWLYALKQGFGDAVDDTGPWILMGLLIAALLEPFLKTSLSFGALPDILEVPLFALIGMPLYVCASGATPLAAVLIHSGVSPGAGLAFLLTGPATNVTTFVLLSKYHGRRFATLFALFMATLAILMGLAVNALFDPATLPPLFETRSVEWALLQNLSLILLTGVFLLSLLRRGPRNLLSEILVFEGEPHDHAHGHDHSHADFHAHAPTHGHAPFVAAKTHKDDCCH